MLEGIEDSILETFRKLLKSDLKEAFDFALAKESLPLIRLAREAGADINHVQGGITHLHYAVLREDESQIRLLSEANASIDFPDRQGRSALQMAFTSSPVIAKALLEFTADIHIEERQVIKQLGKEINPLSMSLICAQTRKRKQYQFTATVLPEYQVEAYLDLIKNIRGPIEEYVMIKSSNHWWAVKIKIENNEIKLLLLDSIFEGKLQIRHMDFLRAVKIQFSDPQLHYSVYLNDRARQHNGYNCSSFTLMDIKDLHKMDRYLPEKYAGDIFEYCAKNNTGQCNEEGWVLNLCQIPLRMMRASQTDELISKWLPAYSLDEQNHPINQRRETALMSAAQDIKIVEDPVSGESKFFNERASRKFTKVIRRTLLYLRDSQMPQISEEIEKFTLVGLKKRVLGQN